MARHTAKSHKIRKVEILVIQIEICKYFLNAFVNFFLQKHYKLIFGFLKIIVLKFLSNRVEGGD